MIAAVAEEIVRRPRNSMRQDGTAVRCPAHLSTVRARRRRRRAPEDVSGEPNSRKGGMDIEVGHCGVNFRFVAGEGAENTPAVHIRSKIPDHKSCGVLTVNTCIRKTIPEVLSGAGDAVGADKDPGESAVS